jgi:IS4 transposase
VLEHFFFGHAKRNFFFQNLTLGYMTKTLNQIFFFPPPKSEYFFQQHWESEYLFRKKKLFYAVNNNGLHPHLLTLGGARVLSVIRSEPLRKSSDVFLTYQVSR